MRINRYIASSTKYSRRKAEELVLDGRVKISPYSVIPAKAGIQPTAEVVTNLATEVNPLDKVFLDNKLITPQKLVYYALNKPVGYTTTTSDPHAKRLITELVPKNPPVFPVGRLDKDTSGLIFLTNDGDFAQKMTHPKYEKEKEYIVETDKELSEESLEKLRNGIKLEDGITAPAKITPFLSFRAKSRNPSSLPGHSGHSTLRNKPSGSDSKSSVQNLYSITIHEGRNRQIRRMIESVGAKVISLKRIRIGDFELGDLEEGKYITLLY